jgi:uncharacterized protein (DUF1697 family)
MRPMSATRYVAFLRAINVGGHVVKMDVLRTLCESVPLTNVSTFIASGNVIFESKRPSASVEAAIEKKLRAALGYEVATMVRSGADLAAIVQRVTDEGLDRDVTLYVGLLKDAPPAPVVKAVGAMSNAVDLLSIEGREVFWRCRTSFSESTIAGPRLEKALGRPVTMRNYNTIRKLAAKLV